MIKLTMQPMKVQEINHSYGFNFQPSHEQVYKFRKSEPSNIHMINASQKIQQDLASTNMASLNYSLKDQLSLHSEFFSIKIEDMQQNKNISLENESQIQEQSSFFKADVKKYQNHENDNFLVQNNGEKLEKQQTQQSQTETHQINIPQNNVRDSIQQKLNEKDPVINMRKSYTSSLHEIVDRNHLQSPSHKLAMQNLDSAEFQNFKLEHEQIKFKKNQNKFPQKNEEIFQVSKIQQEKINIIKPVLIERNLETDKNEKSDSNKSPKQKSKNNRVQIRRIPSNLYESFDQLLLSVNKNEKLLNKGPLDSPIKLKEKSNGSKSSNDSKQNDKLKSHDNSKERKASRNKKDEQILVNLPIVEGLCKIEEQSGKHIETKFVINKNELFFHNERTILINQIDKIKMINKDERQLTIKISYQLLPDNKKLETLILGISNLDDPTYFNKSYQFYSEIILRKLLLMKISINEVNQKFQTESYVRSCQSSPSHHPMNHAQTIKIVEVQNKQVLEAQLFKKAFFYNSWQKKYFSLSSNSLQSFSSPPQNGQKSKPQSNLNKTSEIWTRFQLIYGYLVIKLWQNKFEKIQIGIPLCDFTRNQGKNNWLHGLSKQILWGKDLI